MGLFFIGLLKVILINIVMSGDNAVVIAMAARSLPRNQQKKAYLFGSLGAVILMIALTFVAIWLLRIPFLQMVGGLLLLWIAVKLLKSDVEKAEYKQHTRLKDAIKTIIMTDLVMSLDNTIAVAAAAKGNLWLIGMGLTVSVPLIIWGSQFLTTLMNRFSFIVYAGACLLGYTGGELIMEDRFVGQYVQVFPLYIHWLFPIVTAVLVLIIGLVQARKNVFAR